MSDRLMSSIGSTERSLRQRFLDAASAAANIVLPVFGPCVDLNALGTYDGEWGQMNLTAGDLSAPIQQVPMPGSARVANGKGHDPRNRRRNQLRG